MTENTCFAYLLIRNFKSPCGGFSFLDHSSFFLTPNRRGNQRAGFQKGCLPRDGQRMDEKAKSRAFYVSRLAELEAVGRVKDYLVDNLKDKTSFQNFVKNLDKDELLKKAGWEEDGGWYWETVYRTNTMSAFNAGRAEAFEEYEPEFLEFIGIEDFRQTPVCASRSGIVKKRTDPFWKKNFPPLHFNCRSTVRPVYAEEAAAFGIKESAEVSLPDAPAKGFGKNPVENWDGVTEEVKARYERLFGMISRGTSKLGIKQGVQGNDLVEIQKTFLPDDGAVTRLVIDDTMREGVVGSFLNGTVRLSGKQKTPALLKSAAGKIKEGKVDSLTEDEYEAMITLFHEYAHGRFPFKWEDLGKNAKNKMEILTELYARTKIALRDEIKDERLRKNIIVNSKGYPDLIRKNFLEESGLKFDRESVEKLNEAVVKDLESLQKDSATSFANLLKYNKSFGIKLLSQAASKGISGITNG